MEPVLSRGDATKNSRYDTQALVTELKKERRNGLLLGGIGVVIAIFLLVLYLTESRQGDVPVTPASRSTENTAPPASATTPATPSSDSSTAVPSVNGESTSDSREAVKPATMKAVLTKKTLLWVDGKPVTHSKDLVIDVPAGTREVKLKLGKKIATEQIDFKPGVDYELRFDLKNEKALFRKLK